MEPNFDLKKIITDPNSADQLVKFAEACGKALAQNKEETLTTSQIRAVFGEVRQIQAQWSVDPAKAGRRLILLKPKMAYRAKKEGKGVQTLEKVLRQAVDLVTAETNAEKRSQNFERFVELFEAILAYHKAYGGN